MYQQSRLEVNGKKQHQFVKNEIGAPTVMQQKGKNTATLKFITPRWFYFLLVISILGWVILTGYWLRNCYSNIYLKITK
ncbi:hypothetical protein [Lactobacillus psittaci]|uniref:hypothetical protein n=1 Tax=Lactobacillus psittaci TaxID=116089 RepID=UPI0004861243|nr:hypothetical protein [Lactobacillus psittaci]